MTMHPRVGATLLAATMACGGCSASGGTDEAPSAAPTSIAATTAVEPELTTTTTTTTTTSVTTTTVMSKGADPGATAAWLLEHSADLQEALIITEDITTFFDDRDGTAMMGPCRALGMWADVMAGEPPVPDPAVDEHWQAFVAAASHASATCIAGITERDPAMTGTGAALKELGAAGGRMADSLPSEGTG
ncbi:MAG: hypothetical protein JWM05_1728 [Acidimicrobiales bacterium]|nr:hypothetical protein [Acidimicrobiales bacterium]